MSDTEQMIGGRYRLLRTIGSGGMGLVWEAHDEVLGRDVAVKEVLPPQGERDPDFTTRTFREARAAGRVAHRGVAQVYDVLEEHGHPWIVMELVRSRTLGALVREDGPLPPAEAAAVGLEVLAALRAAHAAGVLHRDVKPDNVLVAEDGRTVLTDFGIAITDDDSTVTRTGMLVGTPAFIAPERAAGGRAVPASDLWSLGVTLYTAVEGRSPFQRDHPLATLGAVMHAEPEPTTRAGPLAPVLYGLLAKDPADRMPPHEAENRLRAVAAGHAPDPTAPVRIPATGRPWADPGTRRAPAARRSRVFPPAGIVAAAVAAALATGGMAWLSTRTSDSPPPVVPTIVSTPTPSSKQPVRQSTPPTVTSSPQQAVTPTEDRTPTPSRRSEEPSAAPTEGQSTEERSAEPTEDSPSSPAPDPEEPGQVDPQEGEG
ncbi:protein kinase [Nonomuraea sp. NPDC046570]|uniref:serine/threonine-protein kinase n=1 Tax=Nonomuraea sp. NPDC046570 TaxID=3155255 RepID=UPI0033DF591A